MKIMTRCRRYLLPLSCLSVFSISIAVLAATDTTEQNTAALESLRAQIKEVESSIQDAASQSENLLRELQRNEAASVKTAAVIADVQSKITAKKNALSKLKAQQAAREASLKSEQTLLARQIRVAYASGRNDYIKLLLNQEDPALVGRVLAYHRYVNRARSRRIDTVETVLANIIANQQAIVMETQRLEQLQLSEQSRLDEYHTYRQSRSKAIKHLQAYAHKQNKELQILQRNEEELALLIAKLRQRESIVELYENMPPFDSLKGRLAWPVKGEFTHRFGQRKKGGKLTWQGVTIRAQNGADIHAVSTGKVIFADWFRNMGLLLILDHGDGYMSLYSHNQSLRKKSGDWVSTGEVIASAGDTGGQQDSALHFQIRKNGAPKDPALWCRK